MRPKEKKTALQKVLVFSDKTSASLNKTWMGFRCKGCSDEGSGRNEKQLLETGGKVILLKWRRACLTSVSVLILLEVELENIDGGYLAAEM